MRKTCLSAPWGVPGAAALGWGLGFRKAMFPSLFQSWWRLSPLFSQDAQIFIFPAPISYLGDQ